MLQEGLVLVGTWLYREVKEQPLNDQLKWNKDQRVVSWNSGNLFCWTINYNIPCRSPIRGLWFEERPKNICRYLACEEGGIPVWDCFSWNKLESLVIVNRNQNTQHYDNILNNSGLITLQEHFDGSSSTIYTNSQRVKRTIAKLFVEKLFNQI